MMAILAHLVSMPEISAEHVSREGSPHNSSSNHAWQACNKDW